MIVCLGISLRVSIITGFWMASPPPSPPHSGFLWTTKAFLGPRRCSAGHERCGATNNPSARRPPHTLSTAPPGSIDPGALITYPSPPSGRNRPVPRWAPNQIPSFICPTAGASRVVRPHFGSTKPLAQASLPWNVRPLAIRNSDAIQLRAPAAQVRLWNSVSRSNLAFSSCPGAFLKTTLACNGCTRLPLPCNIPPASPAYQKIGALPCGS